MVDAEHHHLSLILLYLFGVHLDILDECFLPLEQELLLVGAFFESDLMVDAGLYLLYLLVESGDGGDDSIQLCIAFA